MEAVIGAGVGLIAALAGTFRLLRRRGRLRASIVAELAVLKELPEGDVRRELERHVERQVRALIAEEELMTVMERSDVQLSVMMIVGGAGLLGLYLLSSTGHPALNVVLDLFGFFAIGFGLHLFARAWGEGQAPHRAREMTAEKEAEVPPAM